MAMAGTTSSNKQILSQATFKRKIVQGALDMEGLQEEQTYHHFSHNHPMVRTTGPISDGNINCSGCKVGIHPAKGYYTCKTCPFYLHQVCYNMPRKTRHPSHPSHPLTLQVVSSSSEETLDCEACGHRVNGFYYNCVDCCVCYHTLCSVLPLSVSINSHIHSLKLEFSPPCDLQCDICKILAYNGWLYRCQICEFDAHIACAISNQMTRSFRHPTAPFLDSSTSKIKPSSTSLMETTQREDYVTEGTELMELVSLGVTRNISDNIVRNGHMRSCPKPDNASIPPSPIAQESDSSSYQFSDGCFSIDLAGSFSNLDVKNRALNESRLPIVTTLGNVKETPVEKNNIMLDRITSNFEPKKQEIIYVKKESFDSRMSEAFLTRNGTYSEEQRNRMKMSNESRSMHGTGYQSKKSENGRSDCSCWPNLFQS